MMQVKNGDKVKVHYSLKLDNGEVIESSVDTIPLEFTLGGGKMIPGFENGIIGMNVGEKKAINIPYKEAYGPRNEEMVFDFPKSRCPQGFDSQVGQQVQMFRPDGSAFKVTVINITEENFTMDANHPLAGRDLVFDLELIEIAV
ncbi:MAG: peptidylprolyl isomerase [Nitrospirae bacterium]|nr:peptidylprolyl isomerase [Nitrospirota bacterium]